MRPRGFVRHGVMDRLAASRKRAAGPATVARESVKGCCRPMSGSNYWNPGQRDLSQEANFLVWGDLAIYASLAVMLAESLIVFCQHA
jgi:hypothetical protein